MEIVIFIAAQAAGKSSFYKQRFFDSHVRVNLDMLRTRHRERTLLARRPVHCRRDNTNATRVDRQRYLNRTRRHQACLLVRGFYFQPHAADCIRRNRLRNESQRVPDTAIRGTINRLELPQASEGFDELSYVRIEKQNYVVKKWKDEV